LLVQVLVAASRPTGQQYLSFALLGLVIARATGQQLLFEVST
jgi:hypothetical protein